MNTMDHRPGSWEGKSGLVWNETICLWQLRQSILIDKEKYTFHRLGSSM
jgi:hypothetical protein